MSTTTEMPDARTRVSSEKSETRTSQSRTEESKREKGRLPANRRTTNNETLRKANQRQRAPEDWHRLGGQQRTADRPANLPGLNKQPGETAIAARSVARHKSWFERLDWSFPAILIYFSLASGILIGLLNAMDLLVGWPFHRARPMFDLVFMICGGVLAGMSWHTAKRHNRIR